MVAPVNHTDRVDPMVVAVPLERTHLPLEAIRLVDRDPQEEASLVSRVHHLLEADRLEDRLAVTAQVGFLDLMADKAASMVADKVTANMVVTHMVVDKDLIMEVASMVVDDTVAANMRDMVHQEAVITEVTKAASLRSKMLLGNSQPLAFCCLSVF
ncbi:uncharacterized protein LOC143835382 [Paroedura picta]|uniref:uncharacterized protein LOC143835382 n=1 Tax=Paroedura picta TaxID=143630 RepID=UPI004056574C